MKVTKPLLHFTDNGFFYNLANYSQDVFWIRQTDYVTLQYVSIGYEHIWGQTCQSLYANGDSWLDSVHSEDKELVEYDINQLRHNPIEGERYKFEYRILHPDGHQRRVQEVVMAIYDTQHQLQGFCGIVKDITPVMLRLYEVDQASVFFRFFAEKLRAVFWARDTTCNKQLYISPGYEKIWERSCASLYENPGTWFDTLHPEDRMQVSNASRVETMQTFGKDVQYEFRYRIYTPEGELRWIKDTSFPIQDESNQFIGFAGIAEDITKEVLHEQQLREAISHAEVANQVKSDFLAMISHELRTPLNAILGMAQILKAKGIPGHLEEHVDIISSAGHSLLSLVSDILDFAKLEAGKLSFTYEPFNLRQLFSQVVSGFQYQADEKQISLKLEFLGDVSSGVIGDANRVRQILVNLLGNSLKFTDQGSIKVSVQCIKQSKNKALFEVAVQDSGIGIRKDKLAFVFEKFSQIDSIYRRKHAGIGLGLAITKQLIEAMGGEIYVKSEYGQGSTFRFTIPLTLQAFVKPVEEEPHFVDPDSTRKQYHLSVLLVEDNLINQKIAKAMLEDFGCVVEIIDNGQSVLEKKNEFGRYHLIFMDVGLPDISGFDIVKQLREVEFLKRKPIVAMTAHILDRDRQQAFASGMDRIIAKPISYNEIGMVLEEVSRVFDLSVE